MLVYNQNMTEIHKIIKNVEENTGSLRWIVSKLSSVQEVVDFFDHEYPSYVGDVSSQYYFYSHGTKEKLCQVCNSRVANPRKNLTCSKKCTHELHVKNGNYAKRHEKIKKTNLDRYGHESHNKNSEVQVKRKRTMVQKYGALVSDKTRKKASERSSELNIKGRQTLIERYGVSNPSQLSDHQEKVTSTFQEKYGVDHYSKSEQYITERKNKRIQYWREIIKDSVVTDVELGNTSNPNERISVTCNECGRDSVVPHETAKWRLRNYSRVCRDCIGITDSVSGLETEVFDFVTEVYSGDVIRNDRGTIFPYELDMLLPELGIAIEFNGLYWHSVASGKDKNYHRMKHDMCKRSGISLIQIFEDEWLYKKDIVKSIIKAKLGLNATRIYARKCRVEKISHDIAKEFLNRNHLMGYKRCSEKYGLFHGDELMQVMTFSRGNKSRRQSGWEIDRFSTKMGVTVTGGASKLFTAFIRDISPQEVISYADLRYGDGNVYSSIGMTREDDTSVGYWYFKTNDIVRIHRYHLRKTTEENKTGMTEFELRDSEGYHRIYDAGNAKWRYTR